MSGEPGACGGGWSSPSPLGAESEYVCLQGAVLAVEKSLHLVWLTAFCSSGDEGAHRAA